MTFRSIALLGGGQDLPALELQVDTLENNASINLHSSVMEDAETYPRRVAISFLLVTRAQLVKLLNVLWRKIDNVLVGSNPRRVDRLGQD